MTWTLGAYTTLHSPLNYEAKPRHDAASYEVWRMADGTVRKHMVGAERWVWEPSFDVGGTDYANLLAAYLAADEEPDGVDFYSWDDTDTAHYTVIVHSWTDDPYKNAQGTRHKVSLVIEGVGGWGPM